MIQGEQYFIEMSIKKDGELLPLDNVTKIIFKFDDLEKIYSEDSEDRIEYIEETGVFKVYLTQEETNQMKDFMSWQVAVKDNEETIVKSKIRTERIYDSIIEEV